jgi:TetR/AcrR family transcriptional regulator of autoinduction and epiphytic fitness
MRLARMAVGETMRDPALAAEMNAKLEKTSAFRRFFLAAAAAGAIRTRDPELAAAQFLGVIKSQAFWPVIFSGQVVSADEMERIVETTVALFLTSLGAEV